MIEALFVILSALVGSVIILAARAGSVGQKLKESEKVIEELKRQQSIDNQPVSVSDAYAGLSDNK